mgnify:CR=1 FL=1
MIQRINKLLSLLSFIVLIGLPPLVVAIFYYWNPAPVTVKLGADRMVHAPLAFVLLATFAFGAFSSGLFGLYYGLKWQLRERKLSKQERKRVQVDAALDKARAYVASHEWGKARSEWQKLAQRHPDNVAARIELSKSLQESGQAREALKILDAARAEHSDNIEVLYRAAEANLELGNKTAAIDNLALILYHHPSQRAARMARDLSEDLDRLEDALEYQAQLEKLGGAADEHTETLARIRFKQIMRDTEKDLEARKQSLQSFHKRYPKFVPALRALASTLHELKDIEEAAKTLVKTSQLSADPKYWQEAAALWLDAGDPDRAVAAARAGVKESSGPQQFESELALIRLYLRLGMLDDAKQALVEFDRLVAQHKDSKASGQIDPELTEASLHLKGRCYSALGQYDESARIWKELSEVEFLLPSAADTPLSNTVDGPPAPRLSTP